MTNRIGFDIEFNLSDEKIFFDSASIGKMPLSSIEIINEYFTEIGSSPMRAMYQDVIKSNKLLESSREDLGKIFAVNASEISFLSLKETALTNLLFGIKGIKNMKIITSVLEDHSVLAPIIRTNNVYGSSIEYLTLLEESQIIDNIQEKIEKSNSLVVISSLTVTNGVKRNWEEITELCKQNNAKLILDISNSVGHEEFNFNSTQPDIVISSGCTGALGPPGTAFQIISKDIENEIDPLIVGGNSVIALEEFYYQLTSSGSKYETGIINLAGILGLTNSLKLLNEIGFSKIEEHEIKLHKMLRKGLESINEIEILRDENLPTGPIITFGSEKFEAHDLAMIMEDMNNIIVRSGALCAHLFMYEQKFSDIIRISTHLYNTAKDVELLIESLKTVFE